MSLRRSRRHANPLTRHSRFTRLRAERLEDRRLLAVSGAGDSLEAEQALELFATSPALFVENQGQWGDDSVRYLHSGSGASVAMTDDGIRFQLSREVPGLARDEVSRNLCRERPPCRSGAPRWTGPTEPVAAPPRAPSTELFATPTRALSTELFGTPQRAFPTGERHDDLDRQIETLEFSASYVGANTVQPIALDAAASTFNYFVGEQSQWRSEVPSYEKVAYEGLYPGIDLVTWGLRSHLKYEFHVAPGADWSQIQVHYDNIAGLAITDDGALSIDLPGDWGTLTDDAPYIYQVIDGQQVEVAGQFVLVDEATYAFAILGNYDPHGELVIDPDLDWSTYLGGSGSDYAFAVAVDSGGNVLVGGRTASSGWTAGGYDTTFGGGDAFVVKLSPAGAHLWSTYVGGSSTERGHGIAVDSADNILLTGQTESAGWVSGGYDTTFSGSSDAFAVKLSPSGGHLWSTYLGGSGVDTGDGIAVDSTGNILVTGSSDANSAGWVSGGYDTTHGGRDDAFVVKLSPTGEHLWGTYLGSSGREYGYGVAADSAGNLLVTGNSNSPGWVSEGYDTTYGGTYDAFVVKLSPTGGHLWSTYLGGSSPDRGYGIAVDAADKVLVTGLTGSTGWVSGGYDTTHGDRDDAFVVKLSPSGSHLWSTFLGGSGTDRGYGIAVDSAGNVLVMGYTTSPGWVSGGFDTTYNGGGDAFVVKLSEAGSHVWSTYLGGNGLDGGYGITVNPPRNVLVTGYTYSAGWVSGGYDTTHNSSSDAFVVNILDDDPNAVPPRVVESSLLQGDLLTGGTFTYTARFDEPLRGAVLDVSDVTLTGLLGNFPPVALQYDPDTFTLTLDFESVPDGVYALTLRSGDGQFEHLGGPNLDGERHPQDTVPSGDGSAGGDFVVDFFVDGGPPNIVDSSLLAGDVREAGPLTYSAQFSEPLDPTSAVAANVLLVGSNVESVAPTSVTYSAGTKTLTAEFPNLPADQYTLTLRGGTGGIRDQTGNLLDGEPHPTTTVPSGDGAAGGDFTVGFDVVFIPELSGTLGVDTVLSTGTGPWLVTGNVTVPVGVTLTIEPGVEVRFEADTRLTVRGRLLAEGTESQRIRLTRDQQDTTWVGVHFSSTTEDNRLAYVDVEYADTTGGAIGLFYSRLTVEHAFIGKAQRHYIKATGSSLVVRNSVFDDHFAPGEAPPQSNTNSYESIQFTGILEGGQVLIEGNTFGTSKGHNDIIDLSIPKGPVAIIRNNVFHGGGDDLLDLGGDVLIEGNLFMNVFKDQWNTSSGEANVISTGDDLSGQPPGEVTVVRNVFYNLEHAAYLKNDTFGRFEHNTFVGIELSAIHFVIPNRGDSPGQAAYLDGNIFYDIAGELFGFADTAANGNAGPPTDLVMHGTLIPASHAAETVGTRPGTVLDLGEGNFVGDPLLADVPGLDFGLLAGSPALGAGFGGMDLGALVPGGAWISQVLFLTEEDSATLQVAGPAIVAYRYRLDGGDWSDPAPVATPIKVTDLANGPHQIEVIGQNFAGEWQDESDAATREWIVGARVVGRHLFYNNSAWDGNGTAISAADDAAIAPDKVPLLPGETAGAANYTSYVRGINGVMIDLAGAGDAAAITADDFVFHVGNTSDPAIWPLAALPSEVAGRPGEGTSGTDRITLVWDAADAVKGAWLQVTVLANQRTGLAASDVFYFGSAPGDAGVGNLANVVLVDAQDRAAVRDNPRTLSDPAPVTDPHDFNRDRLVNATDRAIVQANPAGPMTGLVLFTAPGSAPAQAPMDTPLASPSVVTNDRPVVTTSAPQSRQAAAVFDVAERRVHHRLARLRPAPATSDPAASLSANSGLPMVGGGSHLLHRRHRAANVDRVMEHAEDWLTCSGDATSGHKAATGGRDP